MQIAPRTPNMMVSSPVNIVNAFIKLREVVNDVACLNLGRKGLDYRGIVSVSPISFSLLSEEDQEALIEGFKGFLNGISFPIQILIRNLPYDIDSYIQTLETAQGDMADLMRDHAEFVRQLASKRALVKRSFYIIVPADYQNTSKKTEALINAQMQIKLRIEELLRQLERLGLSGHRLSTMEIIQLYQSCITPHEARRHSITEAMFAGAQDSPVVYQRARYVPEATAGESVLEQAIVGHNTDKKRRNKKEAQREKGKLPSFVKVPDLITPSCIQIFPSYIRIDGEYEHEFVRTLVMTSYPRSAYPGWLDSIIQIDEPNVDFSIHVN